jgi:hypothetical protein
MNVSWKQYNDHSFGFLNKADLHVKWTPALGKWLTVCVRVIALEASALQAAEKYLKYRTEKKNKGTS